MNLYHARGRLRYYLTWVTRASQSGNQRDFILHLVNATEAATLIKNETHNGDECEAAEKVLGFLRDMNYKGARNYAKQVAEAGQSNWVELGV